VAETLLVAGALRFSLGGIVAELFSDMAWLTLTIWVSMCLQQIIEKQTQDNSNTTIHLMEQCIHKHNTAFNNTRSLLISRLVACPLLSPSHEGVVWLQGNSKRALSATSHTDVWLAFSSCSDVKDRRNAKPALLCDSRTTAHVK
jgi:hypothetical protein